MADSEDLMADEFDDKNDGSTMIVLPPSPSLVPTVHYSGATLPPDQKKELSTAPRKDVRLPRVNIGAVEILTFFPNHTQWPDVLLRLKKSGWHTRDIARVQLFARGYGEPAQILRRDDALRQQLTVAGTERIDPNFTETSHRAQLNALVITADARTYRAPDHLELVGPVSLARLAHGVENWPNLGPDRSWLTKAVMWAVQNDTAGQYTTRDVARLAVQHHWQESSEAGNTEAWDTKAKTRILARMAALGYHDP